MAIESTVREVLPYAIEILKKKGYKLVTVAECLGENAYNRGAPKGYNSVSDLLHASTI